MINIKKTFGSVISSVSSIGSSVLSRLPVSSILSVLSVTALLVSCKEQPQQPVSVITMGTVCTINAFDDGTRSLYSKLTKRLEEIDATFSTTKPDSLISEINRNAGKEPVEISDEAFKVINRALYFAELSEGAFDPTIGPLVNLWAINSDHPHVPTEAELSRTLPLVNYKNLKLTQENGKSYAFLAEKDMALELGGIVKGYSADSLCAILKENNVKKAVLDLGGNIYCYGEKVPGTDTPWKIGIKNPTDGVNICAVASVGKNTTVVSSGNYERFFLQDGILYHHILNTKTGFPEISSICATSILCSSSMTADALSTTAFILGPEKFQALLEKAPELSGTEALFIYKDGTIRILNDKKNISINDPAFSIEE